MLIIVFSGFDSRHIKNESAKSSFLIFSYLTFQVFSAGHILFTKSISSLLGLLYQMSQSVIVYVYCFQWKYPSWQLEGGLRQWEEDRTEDAEVLNIWKDFFHLMVLLFDFLNPQVLFGFVSSVLSMAKHNAHRPLHGFMFQRRDVLFHASFTHYFRKSTLLAAVPQSVSTSHPWSFIAFSLSTPTSQKSKAKQTNKNHCGFSDKLARIG